MTVVGQGSCVRLRGFVVCAGRVIGRRRDFARLNICPGVLHVLVRIRLRVRKVGLDPFLDRLARMFSVASNDGSVGACITWVGRWSLFKEQGS